MLTECEFNGNVATEDGGGGVLYGLNNLMMVSDCNFAENTANYGGALYFDENCIGAVLDSRLIDNDANADGGGVYLHYADVIDFIACDISGNAAACGGGLYCLYSPDSRIIACEIKHNKASGGVTVWFEYFEPDPNDPNIPLDAENPLDTSDPNFDPNDPNYVKVRREDYSDIAQGGGIYSWVGPRLIEDSEICYNAARTSGGGLYLVGDEDPKNNIGPELRNCLLTNNRAGRDGAGISCNWWTEARIYNCTIADNEATGIPSYGGGLCCSYDSYAEIINSIIWGNEGKRGSQIAVGSGDWAWPFTSTVKVTYSDIQVFQEEPKEEDEPVVIDPSLLGPDTPDYFIYGSYDVNRTPVGVYGWLDEDGVDKIIHFDWGGTAYIYTITIPDGCDADTHPENPYAPGDIAERTLTLERTFDLGENFVPSHASAFYVTPDNREVYVGAYMMGILRYTFDSDEENPVEDGPAGNYVYDDRIAPPTPSSPISWRMETLEV